MRKGIPGLQGFPVEHGFARSGKKHPLYNIWCHIKERCYNKNCKKYRFYGARGIKMCRSWRVDFLAFYKWAISHGWKKGLQIDRKKTLRGYAPWNCRFVTSKKNNNNRRDNHKLTIFGETKNLSQWTRDPRCAVSEGAFKARINRHGWNPEEALITPKWSRQ